MAKLTYDDDSFYLGIEGKTYRLDIHAEANYWYTPGTMYRNNGDPGDPPDEDLEIEKVDANWYLLDEDGEETKVDATDDMTAELYDYLYDMSIDDWESDEKECKEPEDY